MFNTIIYYGSIFTSIATIIASLYKMIKVINDFTNKINDWENNYKRNTMYILKIAILSEELPLIDRIHAGEEYIKLGGNGIIKRKYEELVGIMYESMREN